MGLLAQNNNRSTNKFIEIDGVSHTIAEWARLAGIHPETIRSRIRVGVSGMGLIEKAKW